MKRSLVLGGGGAKIGWASGALQVLMDEANLKFDHIDATSGAAFNLGMLLSGRSATHVASAWANVAPWDFISLHPLHRYVAFWRLPSLVTQRAAAERILPLWGIDLTKLRSCTAVNGHPVIGTFNVLDYGAKRVETIPHPDMDLDYFLAVDAVPGVMPPVAKNGTLYMDAMLLRDANLGEAVRRGADEIWVLWTVEDRVEWRGGALNHLEHIFEICAVGNLKRELEEIAAMNRRIDAGTPEPGDRPVTVHLIEPDEPLPANYLYFRGKRQMQQMIESGRNFTRRYLAERGYLQRGRPRPARRGIRFTETMTGHFTPLTATGAREPARAPTVSPHDAALEFTLTITVSDVERFIANPQHQAVASGVVRSPCFGGTCHVTRGRFNLFVGEPGGDRRMHYELEFKTAQDRRYLLRGTKVLGDDARRFWPDVTTLQVILEEAGTERRVGTGVLRISVPQFLRQLTTFEAIGTTSQAESAAALGRFGRFFLGGLWDTYRPVGASP